MSSCGILSLDEVEIAYEHHVGLYEENARCTLCDSGTLVLTSNRLLWVPEILKERLRSGSNVPNDAIWLELSRISSMEKQSRFLKSSPKIILYIQDEGSCIGNDPLYVSTKIIQQGFTCNICGHEHIDDDFHSISFICPQCGVRMDRSDQSRDSIKLDIDRHFESSWTCTICDYVNQTDQTKEIAQKCALCGVISDFKMNISPGPKVSESSKNVIITKLAFRESGMESFFSKIRKMLEKRSSTPQKSPEEQVHRPVGNIAGLGSIIRELDTQQTNLRGQVSDSLRDLDSLMNSATEMIKLTKKICDHLVNAITVDDLNESILTEDTGFVQSFLQQLGMVETPVTKELLGHSSGTSSSYHVELARELEKIIESLLTRTHQEYPFISLPDLYCYWNRARGSSLLSPQDIMSAASVLPQIGSSYHMTKMPAGSFVITDVTFDKRIAFSISQFISTKFPWKSITTIELAKAQNLSTVLAKEQLNLAEQNGLICCDRGPLEVLYYGNPFITNTK